jgi:hypothetical protein
VGTGLSAVVVICVVHLWLAPESRLYGSYAGQQVCNRTNEIALTPQKSGSGKLSGLIPVE